MTGPITIREIHEDVRLRHHHQRDGRCIWCGHDWPCLDYSGASAALDLLDNADGVYLPTTLRPGPNGGEPNHRLVPDPAPRGDASPPDRLDAVEFVDMREDEAS